MNTTIDPRTVLPDGHISSEPALVLAELQLAFFLTIITIALVQVLRWWRRARLAERSFRAEAPLVPGEAVVHGTVEYARTEEKAVRVEVDQKGSESESSGSWTTSWTETNRRVQVRPFYLRHQSGQRIRVEPTHDVQFFDAMDGIIRVNLTRRIRVAELTPGEEVFAHGQLQVDLDPEADGAGYRGGSHGLVLRPRGRGHLLLAAESLGERFRRRMRRHRAYLTLAIIVCGLVNLLMSGYYSRLFFGKPGRAVVTELKHLIKEGDDGDRHYYRAWLQLTQPRVQSFVDDLDEDLWKKLRVGTELPAWVTDTGLRSVRLATGATYSGALVVLQMVVPLVLLFIYLVHAWRPIRWYEGEVNQSESGRLEDSQPPPPEPPEEIG